MKKSILTITLLILSTNVFALKNSGEIAKMIPYPPDKSLQTTKFEIALDKHPMILGALKGVVESTKYCTFIQFIVEKHKEYELHGSQFNGGELNVTLTYFCYNQTKKYIDAQEEVAADVVLLIKGDYSEKNNEIIDPTISYSACYGSFCGSI